MDYLLNCEEKMCGVFEEEIFFFFFLSEDVEFFFSFNKINKYFNVEDIIFVCILKIDGIEFVLCYVESVVEKIEIW